MGEGEAQQSGVGNRVISMIHRFPAFILAQSLIKERQPANPDRRHTSRCRYTHNCMAWLLGCATHTRLRSKRTSSRHREVGQTHQTSLICITRGLAADKHTHTITRKMCSTHTIVTRGEASDTHSYTTFIQKQKF